MPKAKYSFITYIVYGFFMLFVRPVWTSNKYGKLFIFAKQYNSMFNIWKLSIVIMFVIIGLSYWRYEYISQQGIILLIINFLCVTSLSLYFIGIYSIFPIKQEQIILYYSLFDVVAMEKDDKNIAHDMTYYGLAILLVRFNKLPAVKFPDIYKIIGQLTNAEEEFSGNKFDDLEEREKTEQILRKQQEEKAQEEFKAATEERKNIKNTNTYLLSQASNLPQENNSVQQVKSANASSLHSAALFTKAVQPKVRQNKKSLQQLQQNFNQLK